MKVQTQEAINVEKMTVNILTALLARSLKTTHSPSHPLIDKIYLQSSDIVCAAYVWCCRSTTESSFVANL